MVWKLYIQVKTNMNWWLNRYFILCFFFSFLISKHVFENSHFYPNVWKTTPHVLHSWNVTAGKVSPRWLTESLISKEFAECM